MSIIPSSKFGTCSQCGDNGVPCVKVGKNLFCRDKCHRQNKIKEQLTKSNERNKVRSLLTYQKQEGVLDSTQELIIDLDRVVSRYVRLAAMGSDKRCECYTCGSKRDWTKMQCGHYISRSNLSTRWELENLRVQCPVCNCNGHGNLAAYKLNLEEEKPGITDWLQEQAREVSKPSRDELKELLFHFQQKLKLVETKLK